VKILDFGLAKLAGSEGVTQTGTTVGTVAYMSPEQARGEEVDQRTDIWSLGVVLYEMLAGEPPFRGENLLAISKAILEGQPPPLPRASVSMEPVIGRSLNKSREQRYQAITDLLDELWTTGGGSDATAPKSAEPTVPSIAVLPFANMSADPEQEYFCDGMAEEIINALSPIDGMRVVARTSAFAFKGRHEDVREIGKQLGVTHLLEGSVRKAGTRLRITAQLTSVSDGYQMWSQRFERTMEDVFAVQDQISAAIVERLSADLKGRVPARPSGQRRPQNLAAYDAYLRGRFHWAKGTLEGYTKSIECFEQAVAEDPGYALAYAGLSDACSWFAFLGSKSAEEMAPKAKQAALEAVALDGELAEAHTSLGSVKFYFDWDWHGADREFRRAIELNPDSAVSLQAYEVFLANLGHVDEAIETVKRALELDPLWSKANQDLGFHLCLQKRYDEAIAQLKRTVEIDPNFPLTHFCLGMTYLETGELAPAIEAFRRGFESGGGPFPRTGLAIGYARSGRKTDALTILRRMQELAKEDREPVHIAWVLASLGEKASALDSLEDAYAQRAPMLISMPTFPWWDPLRADPRFEALLRRMNFPETAAAD
ncbi:MAG: tetratricopeptide repeat protein, partial [Vicinamibacterales bacterium]|nr:tetratricopeptide repeat protein [Vicinamibacterales bacterium]